MFYYNSQFFVPCYRVIVNALHFTVCYECTELSLSVVILCATMGGQH